LAAGFGVRTPVLKFFSLQKLELAEEVNTHFLTPTIAVNWFGLEAKFLVSWKALCG
jgi:hypothetical protein